MKTFSISGIAFLLNLFLFSQISQAQIFEWAASAGSGDRDRGEGIVVDSQGNVYTTGFFGGTADFDPGPSSETLTATDERDAFVAKYDSEGNLIWAHQFGHFGDDEGRGITLDQDENVVITGHFSGLTDFDPGPQEYILHGFSHDIFVLKLDPQGNLIWVAQMGANLNQSANDLVIDSEGNIYSTGIFFNNCDFDPGDGEEIISTVYAGDGFISKLDSDGNFEWVRVIRGELFIEPVAIDKDSSNNIYVAGTYQGEIEFGMEENPLTLTAEAFTSSFFCKIDSNGNFIWAEGFVENVILTDMSVDIDGNVVSAGVFNETCDFDPGEDTFEMTAFDPFDASTFVSKLNNDGEFVWAKRMGGESHDLTQTMTTDNKGNVLVAGGFYGYTDFDPGPDTVIVESTYAGSDDIYVCKLNADGEYKWVKTLGNDDSQRAWGIALDDDANIYTTGAFREDMNFATFDGEYILSANGFFDYFIAKWSACSDSYSTDEHTACNSFTWIDGNTYSESNNTATFTMQNAMCCDSIITLDLTIETLDTAVTLENQTLTAAEGDYSYQWLECIDGEQYQIDSATSQIFEPSQNGYYAVEVDNGNCSDTSSCIWVGSVSIDEISENSFSIFPNPTKGEINIEGKNPIDEVRLTNIQGQLVMIEKSKRFDVSDLAPGVYHISIKTEKGIWRSRFVRE